MAWSLRAQAREAAGSQEWPGAGSWMPTVFPDLTHCPLSSSSPHFSFAESPSMLSGHPKFSSPLFSRLG